MTGWVAAAVMAAVAAALLWPTRGGAPGSLGEGAGVERDRPDRRRGVPRWVHPVLRRQAAVEDVWVAEFAELAALALEAGLPPGAAAELAADVIGTGRVGTAVSTLTAAVEAGATGSSVGAALHRAVRTTHRARSPAAEPLGFLGVAWSLSDDLGAPAAGAARACATVLRGRAAAEAHRRVVAAGPRASMWLLTALPLGGPLVGVLLGIPATTLYGRPAAILSAVLGVGLTGVGWVWARAILRRAARPRVLG